MKKETPPKQELDNNFPTVVGLEENIEEKEARDYLVSISKKYSKLEDKIKQTLKEAHMFISFMDKDILPEEKKEEIKKELEECLNIKDDNIFTEKISKIIKKIFNLRKNNPEEFEEAQSKVFNNKNKFIEINRLLSYGIFGNTVHIHAPPGFTVNNKITLYRQGLVKLAEIVKNNPNIEIIEATSPLVKEHTSLFTSCGFEVEDISEENWRKYFVDKERKEIKRAFISRKNLLERFLN